MSAEASSPETNELGILLASFDGANSAAHARKAVRHEVNARGGAVLDDVVLRVDKKGKARIYDLRRDIRGAVTAGCTWGVFGLLAGRDWQSLVVWGVIGAISGGLYAYFTEHILSGKELAAIGTSVRAESSILAAFVTRVEGSDLLAIGSANQQLTSVTAAEIHADLSAQCLYADGAVLSPRGDAASQLAMLLFRYPGQRTAKHVLAAAGDSRAEEKVKHRIEFVAEVDAAGNVHMDSPSTGMSAMARSSLISWGAFGLLYGGLVGWLSGGGVLGFIEDGVLTLTAWGLFGILAGALYGAFAGRSTTGRVLRQFSALLPANSSSILAWSQRNNVDETIALLSNPKAERLVLFFVPGSEGAYMEKYPLTSL